MLYPRKRSYSAIFRYFDKILLFLFLLVLWYPITFCTDTGFTANDAEKTLKNNTTLAEHEFHSEIREYQATLALKQSFLVAHINTFGIYIFCAVFSYYIVSVALVVS